MPNVSIRVSGAWRGEGTALHLFGVGPWRAPGANMNVFAKESQIDIMAAAAGIDPLELRLRNTTDARMRRGAGGGGQGVRLEARRRAAPERAAAAGWRAASTPAATWR